MSDEDLCQLMIASHMQPLWRLQQRLNTSVPQPKTKPWRWSWSTVLPLAQRAAQEVPIDRGGDRRVLALANPGLDGVPFATSTLWGAWQVLGPRETAPTHRHSASAIRFVLQGEGVSTTVNGDACAMEPGDLILTPSWHWHDHTNAGDGLMIWFDGLDLPLVVALDAVFFEQHPETTQPVRGRHLSQASWPAWPEAPGDEPAAAIPYSPLLRYAWTDTDRGLARALERSEGPMVSLDYTNPATGGPVLPTMGCQIHRLRASGRTATRRAVGSSVFVVFRGRGRTVIDGTRFDWTEGDAFAVPSWAAVDHEAEGGADLFSISDGPTMKLLGLHREVELPVRQEVTGVFETLAR